LRFLAPPFFITTSISTSADLAPFTRRLPDDAGETLDACALRYPRPAGRVGGNHHVAHSRDGTACTFRALLCTDHHRSFIRRQGTNLAGYRAVSGGGRLSFLTSGL